MVKTNYQNHVVLNPRKCQYLKLNKDISSESIDLGKKTLYPEAEQKLLGIIIDKGLNFQSYTESIIKTANRNLSVPIRAAPLIADVNGQFISDSFIKRQFNYCPLLWLFSNRTLNHKLNRHNERGLRALLTDQTSTFNDQLSKVTILLFT